MQSCSRDAVGALAIFVLFVLLTVLFSLLFSSSCATLRSSSLVGRLAGDDVLKRDFETRIVRALLRFLSSSLVGAARLCTHRREGRPLCHRESAYS